MYSGLPAPCLNVRVRLFPREHEQVKNGASEADIWQTIDMFKERYSDYGSDRRSAIDFHVNQLEKVRPALSPIFSFRVNFFSLFRFRDYFSIPFQHIVSGVWHE